MKKLLLLLLSVPLIFSCGENLDKEITKAMIDDKLLKLKGIEDTQKISKSTNSKVFIIGDGDGDLPIILGGDN